MHFADKEYLIQLLHSIAFPIKASGLPVLLCFLVIGVCLGQEKSDTVKNKEWINKVNNNKHVKGIMKGISRKPESKKPAFNQKSEDPFLIYDGKIIRKITVQHLGFENTVLDSARNLKNFITHSANRLHTNTKEPIIRNYLFVKEGKPLNPYRVADNERTLRNLDFIMDVRIYVQPILHSTDSVDLLVVTRDVFSLGVSAKIKFGSLYRLNIGDINFGGVGQKVEFDQLFEEGRTPHYGYQGLYRLNNIGGSFIDGTIGYSIINEGVSIGNENEQSLFFKLSRALYQPFARVAGEIEFSDNMSRNVYSEPDSTFSPYRYQIQDYWIGYSFGYKNSPKNLKENRNRKFIAVRAYQQYFLHSRDTNLTEPDRYAYRDKVSLLAQLTFFRQDFYKTQYVVGFGRTEDIPYGYRVSITAGWEKEIENKRPYLGGELAYNHVRPSGYILSYNLKLASYWDGNRAEDGLLALNFSRYSKPYSMSRMIMRHRFEVGYAMLFNQEVKQGININDVNGILGFKPDSLVGNQRMTMSQEEIIFTPWKFLGFRSAFVARADLSLIQRKGALFESQNFFSGFSLGIRARNENLIFNTIEMRLFYYPKTVELVEPFLFKVATNFRIRYPTNLVNKPATVF
jgi:hypothetical protein